MTVASLEFCKELYELSGWVTDEWRSGTGTTTGAYPAYNLGYLLRKLPDSSEVFRFDYNAYEATHYPNPGGDSSARADTPEDAACKLAIELFKQGILRRGE